MSDVNWGLLGNGFNAMESMGVYQQAQDRRRAQDQQLAQQQRQAQVSDLTQRAVGGDAQARRELAGLDYDRFAALDKASHEQWSADNKALGNAALLADTPEKWDQTVQQYVQLGHPEAAKFIGRFDLRNAVIAQAGEAQKELDRIAPKYTSIPEGGTLVNTRDPAAVAAYQGQQMQPAMGATAPPVAAIQHLRQNPALAQAFDAKYGAGASARAMGGAAPQGAATFP